jgi:hypothetical protein
MAVCSGLRNRLRVSLVLILLVASMEVVQLGIPTRHSDLWDVFWGGAGIFAVQAVFELSSRWKFRQRDG